jgi:hypothetical protein
MGEMGKRRIRRGKFTTEHRDTEKKREKRQEGKRQEEVGRR